MGSFTGRKDIAMELQKVLLKLSSCHLLPHALPDPPGPLLGHRSQVDVQWGLGPKDIREVIQPFVLLVDQTHVEVEEDASENQPHFRVCQTGDRSVQAQNDRKKLGIILLPSNAVSRPMREGL